VQLLAEAIQVAAAESAQMMQSIRRMAALGFPPAFFGGSLVEAPFDFMSDTLRGMRGIMLDMLQRPRSFWKPRSASLISSWSMRSTCCGDRAQSDHDPPA
jgi:hypothetical protein